MDSIPALNPGSNAQQIDEFIGSVKKAIQAIHRFGILGLASSISYNESYFGEPEGKIKSLITEINHGLEGLRHDLDAVVPEDTTAFRLVKEALDRVTQVTRHFRELIDLVTGASFAGKQFETDDNKALVEQRIQSYINASDASRAIYDAVTKSPQLIDTLELLASLDRQLQEASLEDNEEDEDDEAASESEDHIQAEDEEKDEKEDDEEEEAEAADEEETLDEGESEAESEGEEEEEGEEEVSEPEEDDGIAPDAPPATDDEKEEQAEAAVDPNVETALDNKIFDELRSTIQKAKDMKEKADAPDEQDPGVDDKDEEQAEKDVETPSNESLLGDGFRHMRSVQTDPDFKHVKNVIARTGEESDGLLGAFEERPVEMEPVGDGTGLLGIQMDEPVVEEPVPEPIQATLEKDNSEGDDGMLGIFTSFE